MGLRAARPAHRRRATALDLEEAVAAAPRYSANTDTDRILVRVAVLAAVTAAGLGAAQESR
jgi:hypothetical protein